MFLFVRPGFSDLAGQERVFHVIDIKVISSRFVVCMFGQVVEAIANQSLNLLDAQGDSPPASLSLATTEV
jgi:hypothetical protein